MAERFFVNFVILREVHKFGPTVILGGAYLSLLKIMRSSVHYFDVSFSQNAPLWDLRRVSQGSFGPSRGDI